VLRARGARGSHPAPGAGCAAFGRREASPGLRGAEKRGKRDDPEQGWAAPGVPP